MILISIPLLRQIHTEEVRQRAHPIRIRQTVVIPVRSEAVQLVADEVRLVVDVVEDVKF